ncbi:MAG: 23S rRNA (uracil(1939)-C(5))-methyltransferase RlmD [Acidobacteriales bacterium]|nr:23S rRNA (uracil(1939)-C(5))-methyltransferase RlmD [Terriglobales bacterium]
MQLEIEKLIYGGDGLARYAQPGEPRGKAVFVPFTLPGEQVEATAVEEHTGFLRAQAERILRASPERIEPHCPYFLRCGGCHYQHTGYSHQLEIKAGILRETLRRTAHLDWPGEIAVHPSPEWNYRNRTRLRMREDPFALGYYRFGSHELLPVEQCPISSPLINRAMTAVWELGRRGGLAGSGIEEMEFFANHSESELQVELYLQRGAEVLRPDEIYSTLQSAMPQVTSAAWFSVGVSDSPRHTAGQGWLEYQAGSYSYRVSAGSFFQTNRFLPEKLIESVTAGRAGKLALDLYAGVGLFAVPLARSFEKVVAVEAAPQSFADLKHNAPRNVLARQAATERFLTSKSLAGKPELVVVDPPRAGLGEKVTGALAQMAAPRLTYVSCDPATAARDLRALLGAGYRLEAIHLVDLFPQTFHIESIFQLVR